MYLNGALRSNIFCELYEKLSKSSQDSNKNPALDILPLVFLCMHRHMPMSHTTMTWYYSEWYSLHVSCMLNNCNVMRLCLCFRERHKDNHKSRQVVDPPCCQASLSRYRYTLLLAWLPCHFESVCLMHPHASGLCTWCKTSMVLVSVA